MARTKVFIFAIIIIVLIAAAECAHFFFKMPSGQKEVGEEMLSLELTRKFNEKISQLDNSEKLINFMNENFLLEQREEDIALSPEQLFGEKKGGVQDLASFAVFVLDLHKYEAGVLYYRFSSEEATGTNAIVVFRDTDAPKYLYFEEGKTNAIEQGWTFEEIIQAEEERLNIRISEYAVLAPGIFNFASKEWRKR